jgi:hypothetical protein
MISLLIPLGLFGSLSASVTTVAAEEASSYGYNANNNGNQQQNKNNMQNYAQYPKTSDYIKYWTTYALLPMRCIVQ